MKKITLFVLMCCSISIINGMMRAAAQAASKAGSTVTHSGFRLVTFPGFLTVIAAGYFCGDAVSDLAKAKADKIRAEADAIRATAIPTNKTASNS